MIAVVFPLGYLSSKSPRKRYPWLSYFQSEKSIYDSFQIESNMIVVIVFLLIMYKMEYRSVHNQKKTDATIQFERNQQYISLSFARTGNFSIDPQNSEVDNISQLECV